jgi:hypothetical protein
VSVLREPSSWGLMLASHLLALCRFMPRSCISAKPSGRLLHLLPCATFFAAEVSVSQAPSPNAMPRRHASPGTRKAISSISDRKPSPAGTAPKSSLPNRALSESGFAHDTPATLCMKRHITCMFVIDISSLRLDSELWQKSLLRPRFWTWSRWQRCVTGGEVLGGDDGAGRDRRLIPERPHACCLAFQ